MGQVDSQFIPWTNEIVGGLFNFSESFDQKGKKKTAILVLKLLYKAFRRNWKWL